MTSQIDNFKAGCSGKVQFVTFTKASSTAKRMRKGNRDCHVEPYHCQHCQHFHVGENRTYHPKQRKKGTSRDVDFE